MIELALAALAFAACLIGYGIGHSEGYSKGRRDGWMQYDSIVSDIQDECDQLKRAAAPQRGGEGWAS